MFYDKSTTDSGIEVLTEHMDSVRSIALGVWVATGSRDEYTPEAGVSHFVEHMMFKGTPTRTAAEISEAFDRIGAEVNAFTSKEYTCYYFRSVDEHLAEGLDIIADMVSNSSMEADAILSEREVVLEEISRRDDAPDDLIHDMVADTMWPDHPLGRPVLGERATVGSFTPEDVRRYVDRRYTAGNLVVAAAGNVDHATLVSLVNEKIKLAPGARTDRATHVASVEPGMKVITKETEQSNICLGMPGLPAKHVDRFVLAVVDTVLGGGMSSRLFQEIREKRGLAYAVYSYHALYFDAGSYVVYAGTRPDNTEEVISLMRGEISRMLDGGLSADELARAKESIKGQVLLGMESTNGRMVRLGKSEVTHGELLSVDDIVERVDAVTAEDALRVARNVLGGPSVLTIIGPKSQPDLAHLGQGQ